MSQRVATVDQLKPVLASSQTVAANLKKKKPDVIYFRACCSVHDAARLVCQYERVRGDLDKGFQTSPLPRCSHLRGSGVGCAQFVCKLSLKLFKVDKSTRPEGCDA